MAAPRRQQFTTGISSMISALAGPASAPIRSRTSIGADLRRMLEAVSTRVRATNTRPGAGAVPFAIAALSRHDRASGADGRLQERITMPESSTTSSMDQPDTRGKPNLIFIDCHDLGRHLGCYGRTAVPSPSLDGLAANGVQFDNAFCTAPQCSPSRAALYTGRHAHDVGMLGLAHPPFDWKLHEDVRYLASYLQEAGWRTHHVGVQHVIRDTPENVRSLGFDHHDAAHAEADEHADHASWWPLALSTSAFVTFLGLIMVVGIGLSLFGIVSEVWGYHRYGGPRDIALLIGYAIAEYVGYRQWKALVALQGLVDRTRGGSG
jgi:hypothetical protein